MPEFMPLLGFRETLKHCHRKTSEKTEEGARVFIFSRLNKGSFTRLPAMDSRVMSAEAKKRGHVHLYVFFSQRLGFRTNNDVS